jgi:hypothetical protein
LLVCRFVLDDHLNVVEHGHDLKGEAVQSAGDNPLKAFLSRLLDTVLHPVSHGSNDTSFGLISPVYGDGKGCTYGCG